MHRVVARPVSQVLPDRPSIDELVVGAGALALLWNGHRLGMQPMVLLAPFACLAAVLMWAGGARWFWRRVATAAVPPIQLRRPRRLQRQLLRRAGDVSRDHWFRGAEPLLDPGEAVSLWTLRLRRRTYVLRAAVPSTGRRWVSTEFVCTSLVITGFVLVALQAAA